MSTTYRHRPACEHDSPAPAAPGDGELLLRYVEAADRGAFEELVRRYEREIFNYLRKYLGDQHLAEDAFQATFLQLHRKCRQFEPGRALRPWLYRIAANQANDLLRRNRRHKLMSLDAALRNDDQTNGESSLHDYLCDDGQPRARSSNWPTIAARLPRPSSSFPNGSSSRFSSSCIKASNTAMRPRRSAFPWAP